MQRLTLTSGLLLLALLWLGPLPGMAPHAFHAHMTMHMGVVAVAAPLIAAGLAGTRFDPVPLAPALFAAIPVSLVELAVVWLWHMPAPHQLARHTLPGLLLEQATFLASGLLLWLAALGGRRGDRPRAAAGVIGLLLTSMHMTLLGAILALSPDSLYGHASLGDQHLGGAIMLLVGGGAYLAGGLWLTAGLLRPQTEKSA